MTIKKNKLTYYFLSILLLTFAFNFYNVTKKKVYKYNHKKMSFGLLLSTIEFNNNILNNIDEY